MIVSYSNHACEAGCDEAGRGCLAGPVFAASVILPHGFYHPKLNDSKKLNESDRLELRDYIEKNALSYGVASVGERDIEEINILNATFKAMHASISKLSPRPEFIIVDGNRFKPFDNIPHRCIVKGDAKYASIAAASILAKTHRDAYMCDLATLHPSYGWENNKGYATLAHRKAILEKGTTTHHRMTFNMAFQTKLF